MEYKKIFNNQHKLFNNQNNKDIKNFPILCSSMVAAALLFASCNRSSNETTPNKDDKGAPALMTIKFDNTTSSKAVGTPVDESVIDQGTILVFRNGSGILDGMATFTSVANPVQVNITAGTRDVYVVANTGIDFSSVQNVSDLEDFANKYSLSAISATGTKLPMSGKALSQNATTATMTSPASATVNLQFMCSKVNIAWTVTPNPDLTSFTATAAYILNVPSVTDCFSTGTNNLTKYSTAFSTGLASFASFSSSAYYPVSPTYTNTHLAALNLTDVTATGNGGNFFYVFENNVQASPTIVVIQGTVTDNGVTTTYYYPIVINGAQNTTSGDGTASIVRGQSYLVTATIKGFGNTDPYEPITNALLDVTIVPATWSPVININQTFN